MSTPEEKPQGDTTDQDPTWCTVNLHITSEVLTEQCPHTSAQGRYVVLIEGEWHGFDPMTKLQALAWVNGRQDRRERICWLCFECSKVMPLGSYEG